MPLLPEEILNKRYRIVGLLGRGQYGSTYRAYDVEARREVAIKEYLDPSVETQKRLAGSIILSCQKLSIISH